MMKRLRRVSESKPNVSLPGNVSGRKEEELQSSYLAETQAPVTARNGGRKAEEAEAGIANTTNSQHQQEGNRVK